VASSEKRRPRALAHQRRFELDLVPRYFKANTGSGRTQTVLWLMQTLACSARKRRSARCPQPSTGSHAADLIQEIAQLPWPPPGGARTRREVQHTFPAPCELVEVPTSSRRPALRNQADPSINSYDQLPSPRPLGMIRRPSPSNPSVKVPHFSTDPPQRSRTPSTSSEKIVWSERYSLYDSLADKERAACWQLRQQSEALPPTRGFRSAPAGQFVRKPA